LLLSRLNSYRIARHRLEQTSSYFGSRSLFLFLVLLTFILINLMSSTGYANGYSNDTECVDCRPVPKVMVCDNQRCADEVIYPDESKFNDPISFAEQLGYAYSDVYYQTFNQSILTGKQIVNKVPVSSTVIADYIEKNQDADTPPEFKTRPYIEKLAKKVLITSSCFGIDPFIFTGLIHSESNFNPKNKTSADTNGARAWGLGQLRMPALKEINAQLGRHGTGKYGANAKVISIFNNAINSCIVPNLLPGQNWVQVWNRTYIGNNESAMLTEMINDSTTALVYSAIYYKMMLGLNKGSNFNALKDYLSGVGGVDYANKIIARSNKLVASAKTANAKALAEKSKPAPSTKPSTPAPAKTPAKNPNEKIAKAAPVEPKPAPVDPVPAPTETIPPLSLDSTPHTDYKPEVGPLEGPAYDIPTQEEQVGPPQSAEIKPAKFQIRKNVPGTII
jgi:hypothetical protein